MIWAGSKAAVDAFVPGGSGILRFARVREGRSGGEETGMAVPKGHALSAVYVRTFVENAKSEGLVKAAIERTGLRGVVVAPPK